jgi:hypothetical protein
MFEPSISKKQTNNNTELYLHGKWLICATHWTDHVLVTIYELTLQLWQHTDVSGKSLI